MSNDNKLKLEDALREYEGMSEVEREVVLLRAEVKALREQLGMMQRNQSPYAPYPYYQFGPYWWQYPVTCGTGSGQ